MLKYHNIICSKHQSTRAAYQSSTSYLRMYKDVHTMLQDGLLVFRDTSPEPGSLQTFLRGTSAFTDGPCGPPLIWPFAAASLARLFFSFLDRGFSAAAPASTTSAAAASTTAATCTTQHHVDYDKCVISNAFKVLPAGTATSLLLHQLTQFLAQVPLPVL